MGGNVPLKQATPPRGTFGCQLEFFGVHLDKICCSDSEALIPLLLGLQFLWWEAERGKRPVQRRGPVGPLEDPPGEELSQADVHRRHVQRCLFYRVPQRNLDPGQRHLLKHPFEQRHLAASDWLSIAPCCPSTAAVGRNLLLLRLSLLLHILPGWTGSCVLRGT